MTKKELIDHLQHLEKYTHYSEDAPALREAIKMLKCSEMPNGSDTISRQAAIDALKEHRALFCDNTPDTFSKLPYGEKCRVDELDGAIATLINLPSAHPEQRWIPIKWHDCTDEDREKYGFSNDIVAVFDCEMPDDDQPILVTTSHGYVNQDVCYIDDGYSLDSGWDWIDDIKAWMPLPSPYQAERRKE